MQALLIAALLWLATLPMTADQPLLLTALLAGCTLVSLLTACQDIAADGLSCRLLGPAMTKAAGKCSTGWPINTTMKTAHTSREGSFPTSEHSFDS